MRNSVFVLELPVARELILLESHQLLNEAEEDSSNCSRTSTV